MLAIVFAIVVLALPPTVPSTYTFMASAIADCRNDKIIMLDMWNDPASKDPDNAELTRFGPVPMEGKEFVPWVWVFFEADSDKVRCTVLTIPGAVIQQLSLQDLKVRYPSPCDVVHARALPSA